MTLHRTSRFACCLGLLAASAAIASPAMATTLTFTNPSSACLASSSTGGVSYAAYSGTGSDQAIEAAQLRAYSGGLGVNNRFESCSMSPGQSTDNAGSTDSVLFDFGTAVDLDSVSFGWVSGDSDFSLLRYTGTGTPTIIGSTYATLASGSWARVDYWRGSLTGTTTVNAANLTSQFWLVAGSLASSNDYFKIEGMAWSTPSGDQPVPELATLLEPATVPEPATLGLLGLGLAALGFARRRRQ